MWGNKRKIDYSSKYGGVICERHWSMDDHRYHADPRAVFISFGCFSAISYDKISGIHLKEETKQAIRELIDQLYDEYVGIHLKSKKFIDQMKSWAHVLKTPEKDMSEKIYLKRRIVNETYNKKSKPFDKHREFRLLLTVDQIDRSLRGSIIETRKLQNEYVH
ncbi:DNA repair protein RecO [Enterococcus lactis]|nr:DNA repair protein RecO [Enterococcus lactis]